MYGQSGITSFWDSGNEKTTVNDPKNAAALEKYVGLFKKDTPAADLNNDFTKMVAQWDSGTIGMLNHNLGSYQDHVKALGTDKFRGIPQPVGAGGKRVQVSNPVDGLGLFKSGKNKDAAWKFIEFATEKAQNSKFNESAGQVPSNNDAAKDAWVSKAEADEARGRGLDRRFHDHCSAAVLPARLEHHFQDGQRARVPEGDERVSECQGLPEHAGRSAQRGSEGVERAEGLTRRRR